ncbi:Breast cancer type 2 susceptibility, partial [Globisporangium splendens]
MESSSQCGGTDRGEDIASTSQSQADRTAIYSQAIAELNVFEQDFDTAMQIWIYQDPMVARLCFEEPRVTRRRHSQAVESNQSQSQFSQVGVSGGGNMSQSQFSQVSLSYGDTPARGARRSGKKRKRPFESQTANSDAPLPPLSMSASSVYTGTQFPNRDTQDAHTQEISTPFQPTSDLSATPRPNEFKTNARASSEVSIVESFGDTQKTSTSFQLTSDLSASLGEFKIRGPVTREVSVVESSAAGSPSGTFLSPSFVSPEFESLPENNEVIHSESTYSEFSQRMSTDGIPDEPSPTPILSPSPQRIRHEGRKRSLSAASNVIKNAAGNLARIDASQDVVHRARIKALESVFFNAVDAPKRPLNFPSHSTVSSLFQTGSGRTVEISKEKLRDYENKWRAEEAEAQTVVPSSAVEDGDRRPSFPPSGRDVVNSATDDGGRRSSLPTGRRPSARMEIDAVGGAGTVSSLFQTGSGRTVEISKEKLRDYENKWRAEEAEAQTVVPSSAVEDGDRRPSFPPSGRDVVNGATDDGGRRSSLPTGRRPSARMEIDAVGGAGTVSSLFQTGSGRTVEISKEKLRDYENKWRAEEAEAQTVVPSSAVEDGDRRPSFPPSGRDVVNGATDDGGRRSSLPTGRRPSARMEIDAVGGAGTVSSLFQTGSGRTVEISKEKLRDYENKWRAEEAEAQTVVPSSAVEDGDRRSSFPPSGRDVVSSATDDGGRRSSLPTGRRPSARMEIDAVGGAGTVSSLFQTGSGRTVEISKEKLRDYENKWRAEEAEAQTVVPSSAVEDGDRRSSFPPSGRDVVNGVVGDENYSASGVVSEYTVSVGGAELNGYAADGSTLSVTFQLELLTESRNVKSQSSGEKSNFNQVVQSDSNRLTDLETNDQREVQVKLPRAANGSKSLSQNATTKSWQSPRSQSLASSQHPSSSVSLPSHRSPKAPQQNGKRRFRAPLPSKHKVQKTEHNMRNDQPKQETKPQVATPQITFRHREEMKISFKRLISMHSSMPLTRVDEGKASTHREVLELINAVTALDVVFACDAKDQRNCDIPPVCLRGCIDTASDLAIYQGAQEIYDEMCSKKYLSVSIGATFAWFLNHYRWIVWKLASMELSFPYFLFGKYLTKHQVMHQIFHRYQKDLCAVRRSVLKKILHRDASPASCMTLCIAAVLPFKPDQVEHVDMTPPEFWNLGLVLTDGWYSVYAVADFELSRVLWKLHAKKGAVGSKIVCWNAALQNSTDGVDPFQCAVAVDPWKHPLLAKDDLTQWPYLKLHYNSTRRAEFATPLGLERPVGGMDNPGQSVSKERTRLGFELLKSVPMRTLEVSGGMVRSVRILIARISPILHLQPKEFTIGPRILCEEQMQLYYEVRGEVARMNSESGDQEAGVKDQSGSSYDVVEQLDAPLPIPFVKLDVICTHKLIRSEQERTARCYGVLTLWRPPEDLVAGHLREGKEYYASNVTVNWKIDGGLSQGVFLRLSSTKGSRFELEEGGDSEEVEQRSNRLAALFGNIGSRSCSSIADSIERHRVAVADGAASNERKMTVDVCVYVLQAAGTETLGDIVAKSSSSSSIPSALENSNIKPEQESFVEHVFVTDASSRIMSVRVSGTIVSLNTVATLNGHQKASRPSSSSFRFRRGNRNVWKEGAIVCISGLEISHFDEQLDVLDCNLVESSQVTTLPSKKSHFYESFQSLKSQIGDRLKESESDFMEEVRRLKKYVDRHILQMDFIPTQEAHEEDIEADRLTQDFEAQITSPLKGESLCGQVQCAYTSWDTCIVKVLSMLSGKVGFPQEIIALAYVKIDLRASKEGAPRAIGRQRQLRIVYFTREMTSLLWELLHSVKELPEMATKVDQDQLTDAELVDNVMHWYDRMGEQELAPRPKFHMEVRRVANERLLNSCQDWERLNAAYLNVESMSLLPDKNSNFAKNRKRRSVRNSLMVTFTSPESISLLTSYPVRYEMLSSSIASKKKREEQLRQRENGFNLYGVHQERLSEHNALVDRNLRHHFENRLLQHHLSDVRLIDQRGRIVDLERQKAKLSIIEQEFRIAEQNEKHRSKEEEKIRRRVQMKRHDARQKEKLL